MTGLEIKTLAESFTDDVIENADALIWINECLNDLSINGAYTNSTTITVEDDSLFYELPSDFLQLLFVLKDGEEYNGFYYVFGNMIRFSEKGEYTVWYRAMLSELSSLADNLQCNQVFHKIISLFVASRYKSKDDDENADALRLMNEYERKKRDILRVIGGNNSVKIKDVYLWVKC